jgi:SAM-dependent methyltransferase
MARMVSELAGFENFEKMLDLGGGHGIFAFYMVRESRDMNAVIFDLPAVEKTAAGFIDAYGMGDRVRTMAGDYLKDPIGEGYDLVWASAALTFAKGDLANLVSKIHDAVKPGGYFIALQDGMTHEGTRPEIILGWLAGLLTTGQDQRLVQGELADIMLAQGFRQVRSRTIDTPMGLLDLDIARK